MHLQLLLTLKVQDGNFVVKTRVKQVYNEQLDKTRSDFLQFMEQNNKYECLCRLLNERI